MMAGDLSRLLDERNEIAAKLADWRRRWDAAFKIRHGSVEHSMVGLKPLDDFAFDLIQEGVLAEASTQEGDQGSPGLVGGGLQPERLS